MCKRRVTTGGGRQLSRQYLVDWSEGLIFACGRMWPSGDDVPDHFAAGDRHWLVQLVADFCLRVDAEQLKQGRGDVLRAHLTEGRVRTELVRGAVDVARFDPAAGHHGQVALRPVVAAGEV